MLLRDTQDGWLKMKSSDKTWPTGEGNHSSILAWRTLWIVWKAKRYYTGRWALQVRKGPICCWEEQRAWLIAPERHEFGQTLGDSGWQRRGVLQSMGLQRVGHNLVSDSNNFCRVPHPYHSLYIFHSKVHELPPFITLALLPYGRRIKFKHR